MPSKAQYQKNKAYYLESARLQSLTPEYKLTKQKYRASARIRKRKTNGETSTS